MRNLSAIPFIAPAILVCLASGQEFSPAQPSFSASPQALQDEFAKVERGSHPAIILLEQGDYEYDAQGRQTLRYRMIFKVLTKAGAENWAMVERTWGPWEEERPLIRARVITKDGSVHELDPKTIADSPARDNGDDVLTDRRKVRAPLPAMEIDSIVEEEIVSRHTVAPLATGVVESFDFGGDVPAQRTIVKIRAPEQVPLHFGKRLLPDVVVTDRKELGVREVIFDQGPMKPLEDGLPLLPSDEPRSPRVVFSTALDWSTVAKAYGEVVEKQLSGFDASKHLPKFPPGATRDTKILAILNVLNKDIRYTGIEFSEASLVPHKPSEVLARKYGDCKDKATLAVALLRAAGIDASVALLDSSTGEDIEADMPGIDGFNHAIVYVGGEPGIWLDPTDPDLTLRTVSTGNQGRYALIAGPQTTGLTRTPELKAEDNRVIERREFQLAELGRAKVIETSEVFGTPDREFRGAFGDLDQKALRDKLKDYVDWTYGEAKIQAVTIGDESDIGKPFLLKIELADAQRGTTARTEALVAIRVSQLTSRLPEFFRTDPKEKAGKDEAKAVPALRTVDFAIREPYTHELHYVITAPPGFKVRQLPEALDEKLGPATLTARFSTDGNAVLADFRFVMPKRRIGAAEGLELRSAAVELSKRKMMLLYFDQIGETALASGRVKEAISEFAALRKLHPTEALHAMQAARAMLAAGAGETARAEAKRAVELEPSSARGYVQLAEVLKHDLVGRSMEKGLDRDGALAAYRKALELDPSDDETRANLAILLEFDESGHRYGRGAKLDESIAEYEKILDKLQKFGVARNYPVVLLRAGRIKELKAYLEKEPESETNQILRVCADAILSGTEAGVRRAGDVSGVDAKRRVLSSAAQTLLSVRQYELAAGLMASASAGAGNPAVLTNLIEVLHKTKRLEELSQTIREPEDAIRIFVERVSLFEQHKDDWREPLSSYYADGGAPDDLREVGRAMMGAGSKIRASGLTLEGAVEVGLSSMQFSREGSDETGWVIRMTVPGNGSGAAQQQVWDVVRENGTYRIVGTNGDFGGVARLVLHLAEDGKLEVAKIWLDRVRQELPAGGSDDPLSGYVFPRVWQQGNVPSLESVRLGAALLLSDDSKSLARVTPILEAATKTSSAGNAYAIAASLGEAYYLDKRYDKALAIDEGLLQQLPQSGTALMLTMRSACAFGGAKEAGRIADSHLSRFKNDPGALRSAATMAMLCGDTERAMRIDQQIIDSGRGLENDYNQLAWAALLGGKVNPATLEVANRGTLIGNKSTALMHTLAAVEAELDKPAEARATLLARITELGEDEPDDDDWYVFGRIAESYGLHQEAAAMYRRLERPKNEQVIPASSYALAQKRLQAIAGAAGGRP
jgi:tetratricopeptide (TPR) repeat protein/transglutaminase-like putative cysteine protease